MDEEQTFPVEMTKQDMRDFIKLIEFTKNNHPFIPEGVWDTMYRIEKALRHSCWKCKKPYVFLVNDAGKGSLEACSVCSADAIDDYISEGYILRK